MTAHWDEHISELDQLADLPSPALPMGERFIRGFLLGGFVLVLLVELWFVLQVFNLF
jgi:hypothetical protein